MFSKGERPSEDSVDAVPDSKKKKYSFSVHYFRSKMWQLQNYEFWINSCVAISSIISSATTPLRDTEVHEGNPLSTDVLGRLVKAIWKGKVKIVRRGARGKQEGHYLHLAKKSCPTADDSTADDSVVIHLRNWNMTEGKEGKYSFVRVENFEVNKQRAVTEVCIVVQNRKVASCTVRACGNCVPVNLEEFNFTTYAT